MTLSRLPLDTIDSTWLINGSCDALAAESRLPSGPCCAAGSDGTSDVRELTKPAGWERRPPTRGTCDVGMVCTSAPIRSSTDVGSDDSAGSSACCCDGVSDASSAPRPGTSRPGIEPGAVVVVDPGTVVVEVGDS